MHNSLVVRTAIVALIIASAIIGHIATEFYYELGEPVLAMGCVGVIALFCWMGFDLLDH